MIQRKKSNLHNEGHLPPLNNVATEVGALEPLAARMVACRCALRSLLVFAECSLGKVWGENAGGAMKGSWKANILAHLVSIVVTPSFSSSSTARAAAYSAYAAAADDVTAIADSTDKSKTGFAARAVFAVRAATKYADALPDATAAASVASTAYAAVFSSGFLKDPFNNAFNMDMGNLNGVDLSDPGSVMAFLEQPLFVEVSAELRQQLDVFHKNLVDMDVELIAHAYRSACLERWNWNWSWEALELKYKPRLRSFFEEMLLPRQAQTAEQSTVSAETLWACVLKNPDSWELALDPLNPELQDSVSHMPPVDSAALPPPPVIWKAWLEQVVMPSTRAEPGQTA